jgi:hypothetical protein
VNPSDQERLTSGIAIQLEDDDIAENLDSYEHPVLFGMNLIIMSLNAAKG